MTGAVKNEFDSRVTLLAYCTTCQILRPPRSFHCHTCNACIEVHDHHCPWVGTCVAKRNHRYFCLFLLATSIHSLATFLISISSMLRVGGSIFYDPNGQDPQHTGKLVVLIYSGLFTLSLLSFFLFQNSLVMKNLTSNEHLRRRWNARQDRQQAIRDQGLPGLLDRLRYFYLDELPKSRIEQYYSNQADNESLIQVSISI